MSFRQLDKLPNEVLLNILEFFYPPAALQLIDVSTIGRDDSSWHQCLMDAHLDMIRISRVSKYMVYVVLVIQGRFAKLIIKEKEEESIFKIWIKGMEIVRDRSLATRCALFRCPLYSSMTFWSGKTRSGRKPCGLAPNTCFTTHKFKEEQC